MSEVLKDPVNPPHYDTVMVTISCADINRHLPGSLAAAFKYVWRAGKKGSAKDAAIDLKKALWYLNDWDVNTPGRYTEEFITARVVFNLITPSVDDVLAGYQRYTILESIVLNNPGAASYAIEAILSKLEKED